MTAFIPKVPLSPKVVTLVFTASGTDTAGLSAYTFSGKPLGVEAADRKIVVLASTGGGSPGTEGVLSVTVAGNSASLEVASLGTDHTQVEAWSVDVPTGTTGDIVVTWNRACDHCMVGIFAVYGAVSTTATDTSSGVGVLSGSINVIANGVALGGYVNLKAGGVTSTWTGITEDYDEKSETYAEHSGGSEEFTTAQTPLAITVTPAPVTAPMTAAFCCLSYGPA